MDTRGLDKQKAGSCDGEPAPKRLRREDHITRKKTIENDSVKPGVEIEKPLDQVTHHASVPLESMRGKNPEVSSADGIGVGSDNTSDSSSQRADGVDAEDESHDDDSDVDCEDVNAFEGELLAHLAHGKTLVQAVQLVFSTDNDSDSGIDAAASEDDVSARQKTAVAKLQALSLPIVAAIEGDDSLSCDVRSVARLCATMYQVAGDEIQESMATVGRPQLELGITCIGDVARILDKAQNVVVLSGAGVSVSCGIPDFRSAGGVYETVLKRYGLTDPQAIFDLAEFLMDPTLFYSFAKDIMPSEAIKPSPTHYFIAELERRGKLLRNYSQNIDGLEDRAGISSSRVVLCHGSFLTATCVLKSCRNKVLGSSFSSDVKSGKVPMCPVCLEKKRTNGSANYSGDEDDDDDDNEWSSVLKPDIVFFGESLPASVGEYLAKDTAVADLVLILGTSMQVAPFARIPQQFADSVPRVLVNRERLSSSFDVELLGNCDSVIAELCKKLDWMSVANSYLSKHVDAGDSSLRHVTCGAPRDCIAADGGIKDDDGAGTANCVGYVFRPPRRFLFPGAVDSARDSDSGGEFARNASTSDHSIHPVGSAREGRGETAGSPRDQPEDRTNAHMPPEEECMIAGVGNSERLSPRDPACRNEVTEMESPSHCPTDENALSQLGLGLGNGGLDPFQGDEVPPPGLDDEASKDEDYD